MAARPPATAGEGGVARSDRRLTGSSVRRCREGDDPLEASPTRTIRGQ
jgi:hypothetical protein